MDAIRRSRCTRRYHRFPLKCFPGVARSHLAGTYPIAAQVEIRDLTLSGTQEMEGRLTAKCPPLSSRLL